MPNPYAKNTWVDEILGGAERYDILENGGGAFKANMQINLATSVTTPGTSVNASRMNNVELGVQALSDLLLYSIAASVASNNLTVTLTHADGTTPSAARPLWVRVNGVWYSFTSAVTYTKNAGTNWHNAGSAEMNGNPIDFFLYAIAETGAAAGVKTGHSRICHAQTMGDFVNTTTNEKYIAGNWTNFNSTDKVQVIGRFRAQLSASASFNWSIASALIINYPIYETDWLNWTPTYTGFSANPTTLVHKYQLKWNTPTIIEREITPGTSNATTFTISLPFTAKTVTNMVWQASATVRDNSVDLTTVGRAVVSSAGSTMSVFKDYLSGAWTASNTKILYQMTPLSYEI